MDCLGSNISYLSVARVTEKEQEEVAGARHSGATAGPAGCKVESHGRELTPSPARTPAPAAAAAAESQIGRAHV